MNNKTIFDLINRTEHSDSRSVLSSIRVLYFAMIIGLLSFLAVTFLISQDFKFYFDKSDPVIFANLILFFLAIPAGYLVSKVIWGKIEKDLPLKDKLLKFQPGFLIRMGTCEGVGLFSIVGLLLSDNLIYLVFTGIILLIIFYYFPFPEKLELQIDLNQTELDELKK